MGLQTCIIGLRDEAGIAEFLSLPNHIAGKGSVRALKDIYPDENIVAVDYDPSATIFEFAKGNGLSAYYRRWLCRKRLSRP